MDVLALLIGVSLTWALGAALVAVLVPPATANAAGRGAWIIGVGGYVGAFLATLWMRALSAVYVPFGIASIGLPLLAMLAALTFILWRRPDTRFGTASSASWAVLVGAGLPRWQRIAWLSLLAWLAMRFGLLLAEVWMRPVYPWDAWIQWATKSRVWYELRSIVPFERPDGWFAAKGAAYYDASPDYPATVSLLQTWACVLLGRWDDALMNVVWWGLGVAFVFGAYGALRGFGLSPLPALTGAWLVGSLPLGGVHIALAGYADLPMASYYALAAVATLRWIERRSRGDAILALLLLAACPTIKTPGILWALTIVPAVAVALLPRFANRILASLLIAAVVVLSVLAQTHPVVLGYRLHLDFDPSWSALFDSFFTLGNWNLLWYGVVVMAIVACRECLSPSLLPMTAIVGSGLAFLFFVFGFTNARAWVADQTTINRATLHLAPLIGLWVILVYRAWAARWEVADVPPASVAAAERS
jgi:hypothetical protein